MRVVLEVMTGHDRGQKILLRGGQTLSVGRTERAEWSAREDPLMSSVHFAVSCLDSGCRLRDLESTNGTFLNGQRVTDVALSDGDEILAGQSRFRVLLPDASQTPPAGVTTTPASESPVNQPVREARAHKRPSGPPEFYNAGLNDEFPPVRQAALRAAAWTRQPWLLHHCRNAARQADPGSMDQLLVLAILAEPADVRLLLDLAQNEQLGPARLRLLGALGHPAGMPLLLAGIGNQDPDVSVPAAAAFAKITGADIDSDTMVTVTPPAGDAPASDVPDPALAPSLDLAREHWETVKSEFATATRWCRGFNVTRPVDEGVLAQLDFESRWEVLLREHYTGARRVSPTQLAPLLARSE